MSCDQTEKISLLIDGELSTGEARAIERHQATCAECSQARADFLGLRSQISAYRPQLESLAVRRALDRVLSKQDVASPATNARVPWRPFVGALASLDLMRRFNPALATAVVLLLVGATGLMIYRSQREIVIQNERASNKVPAPAASQDLVAENTGRKPGKVRPETVTSPRKPNSRVKPARERSKPSPLPQLQKYHPAPTYAGVNERAPAAGVALVRSADAETMTASHLEQAELLLRSFRNVRFVRKGAGAEAGAEISHERKRAQQLVYQNILFRREADNRGDVQVATLLGSLEPVLLDIANLRNKPNREELRAIRDRVERKSLVALLQINSTALARAND